MFRIPTAVSQNNLVQFKSLEEKYIKEKSRLVWLSANLVQTLTLCVLLYGERCYNKANNFS